MLRLSMTKREYDTTARATCDNIFCQKNSPSACVSVDVHIRLLIAGKTLVSRKRKDAVRRCCNENIKVRPYAWKNTREKYFFRTIVARDSLGTGWTRSSSSSGPPFQTADDGSVLEPFPRPGVPTLIVSICASQYCLCEFLRLENSERWSVLKRMIKLIIQS